MSKFKSFAQQGSFRDYQIQAPDETGKIKEETARTIRGKQRAQTSLERQNDLYLQAQKLAQGVEENQREQNFKLESQVLSLVSLIGNQTQNSNLKFRV